MRCCFYESLLVVCFFALKGGLRSGIGMATGIVLCDTVCRGERLAVKGGLRSGIGMATGIVLCDTVCCIRLLD